MYFKITWICQNTLSVAKDAHLNNCSKTTHYTQNHLLNCFIVFPSCYSFKILPAKPLGCSSFLFAQVWVMPTFQTTRYAFSGCPWGLVHCFFSCKTPKKSTRKAGFEVCGRLQHPLFNWERNTSSRQSLYSTCAWMLCLAFTVCIQAAFKLQVQ